MDFQAPPHQPTSEDDLSPVLICLAAVAAACLWSLAMYGLYSLVRLL